MRHGRHLDELEVLFPGSFGPSDEVGLFVGGVIPGDLDEGRSDDEDVSKMAGGAVGLEGLLAGVGSFILSEKGKAQGGEGDESKERIHECEYRREGVAMNTG